ncbi:adenosylcobinamide-GDP ribazoletransferase [Antrihabitans cavernicola]|uniref:Adenosylcobinamide-GDP ribazoletransferase n=1 Tax=Antrihabitans cavernicola TaxID=2495913 RepID=A0A5A7SFR4_9NOCA|nr:adenosylcobinamide-GDP ribazoletransferase [Spelaeibacter cavernicola]KAA0023091.1 adenosylcobinamide-GDP ribazoletransferase [Spelaeibacter cavernicola]
MTGLRLAFSWLTVLPVGGPADVDRRAAGRAIASTPITGAFLGAVAAGLLWALIRIGLEPALAGLIVVATLALASRGMHIDGLADTADGLGCYGDAARAREVMRSGSSGPFGVATIVVAIGVQALAFGALGAAGQWFAVAIAVCAGRVAVVLACRRSVTAADDRGFGALVADTQPVWLGLTWAAVTVAAAIWSVERWWQGPIVVVVALLVAVVVVRHCVRRFGGLNGDVLGAAIEVTVSIVAVGLSAGA